MHQHKIWAKFAFDLKYQIWMCCSKFRFSFNFNVYLTIYNFVGISSQVKKMHLDIVRCINRSFSSKSWAKLAFWSLKCLPNSDYYFSFFFSEKIFHEIYIFSLVKKHLVEPPRTQEVEEVTKKVEETTFYTDILLIKVRVFFPLVSFNVKGQKIAV